MAHTSKLRQSAKGRECQIRIHEVCNWNPETTVLCHMGGGGMGTKQPDLFAAFGCSACHDEVDRRTRKIDLRLATEYFYAGIFRTQAIWLKEGLIKI
jgi:hypothetical protein